MLIGRAGEVEGHGVAVDGGLQAQLEVVAVRGLEHVASLALAVLELRDARAGALLRVVEGFLEGVAVGVQPVALDQRSHALRARPTGGQLRPQVRLALARAAHLLDQLLEQCPARSEWAG